MAKRKPMKLPDSFYALFDYLRSRGYAENSVFEYESHARWITKFMQDNGYEAYSSEAYAAVMKRIENGVNLPDLIPADKKINYDEKFSKTAQPLDLQKGEKLRTQGHVTSSLM